MTSIEQILDALAEAVADRVAQRLKMAAPEPVSDRRLLDIRSAAVYLSRSQSTIRHMITAGDLPPSTVKRIGRRVFLMRTELDRWLEAQ